MKVYRIRTDIMLADFDQWNKIYDYYKVDMGGAIYTTVDEFIKTIGLVGNKSALTTTEEKEFFGIMNETGKVLSVKMQNNK
jgi:hypothetical protein